MAIAEAILWPVAAGMSYIIAALVSWAAGARARLSAAVVLFLLVMMVAMFLGAFLYFAYPGSTGLLLGLWTAAGIMAVSVFPVFWLFVEEVQQRTVLGSSFRTSPIGSVPAFAASVTVAVLAGELVMGRAFQLADGEVGIVGPGLVGLLRALVSCLASAWFLFPMAAEMGLTVAFLRRRIPRVLAISLGLQAASMFASPTAISSSDWVVGSSLAAAALMVGLFGFVMLLLYRGERLPAPVLGYLARLVVVYLVMAGGLVLWSLTGSPALFAVSAVAQMGVFFTTVVVPEKYSAKPGIGGVLLGPTGESTPGPSA
jgi:hypothetical protein